MDRCRSFRRAMIWLVLLLCGIFGPAIRRPAGLEADTNAATRGRAETRAAAPENPATTPTETVAGRSLEHERNRPPAGEITRTPSQPELLVEEERARRAALESERIKAERALRRYEHGSTVAGYFFDRALDLADLFRLRFHVPRGFRSIGFKVRGTVLAQAGFIFFHGKSAGFDRRAVGVWREKRIEGGVGPAYFSKVHDEMISGNRYTDIEYAWSKLHRRGIVRNGFFWDDGRLHPLSCGAELQLFFFGIEFETYPLEYLDSLFGWTLLDSFQDDESRVLRRWDEIMRVPELQVRDEWVNMPVEELPEEEGQAPPPPPQAPEEPSPEPKPETPGSPIDM